MADYEKDYFWHKSAKPHVSFPQSQPGFFLGLDPIPGAIEAVKKIMADDRYTVWVVTAPSVQNPLCYTEKRLWIEKHFGMELVHNMIIAPDKSRVKGDYLIDDRNIGNGQESFEGTLLWYGHWPHQNWSDILKELGIE